jgi:hypothetical protein
MRLPAPRLVFCLLGLALVLVPSAAASHSFEDVPDDHPFHTEIGVFKDTNITSGCTQFEFCPQDVVRRQAMAAFVTRALGLAVRPNETMLTAVPGSKIATIDDGASLVGTFNGALEFHNAGARVLRLEGNATSPNVIGGFAGNTVSSGAFAATVSGGGLNGFVNRVTDNYGTVSGGLNNQAGDGAGTTSDQPFATVGGGASNTASGFVATVGGGDSNVASATVATVAGGYINTASGDYATVPGGSSNTASGDWSFAAGHRAKATQQGAFVWGDSTNADVTSPAVNTFSVRAAGGIWLGTTSTPSIPEGQFLATSSGAHLTTGGTWTNASDAHAKRDFRPVDTQEILRRVARMPIRSWSYKAAPGARHLGPTAQDFRRAFGLGQTTTAIATVDADGVALAAIQALHTENQTLKSRLAALERAVAELAKKP